MELHENVHMHPNVHLLGQAPFARKLYGFRGSIDNSSPQPIFRP
jgi:hypothetical protein